MTTTVVDRAAAREAQALGHHWLGEEHLLLAMAEEAGRDRDDLVAALADHLERYGPPVPKVGEGCMSAPSYHTICGRAEGLALSEGMVAPEARHVLQALLWDPWGVPALLGSCRRHGAAPASQPIGGAGRAGGRGDGLPLLRRRACRARFAGRPAR